MTLGIVGLGLMGGSLALAAKSSGVANAIVGFDASEEHCRQALELGIVDYIVDADAILLSDTIVLAIPVEAISRWLSRLHTLPVSTTIIDLGSTKEQIIAAVPAHLRAQFVAAHPMTGTEFSGPKAAFGTLYEGKTVVLCDLADSGDEHRQKALRLFEGIGMKIIEMEAHEHDRHAAFISHLPHILSYSLANTVLEQEDRGSILALAAGGFRDMSRLAKSSPTMWRDIFSQNRENLLASMELFENQMALARNALETNQWSKLEKWMEEAGELHRLFGK